MNNMWEILKTKKRKERDNKFNAFLDRLEVKLLHMLDNNWSESDITYIDEPYLIIYSFTIKSYTYEFYRGGLCHTESILTVTNPDKSYKKIELSKKEFNRFLNHIPQHKEQIKSEQTQKEFCSDFYNTVIDKLP